VEKENNSYKHIIRSLGFVGGSQIIVIIIGIIKTKIIAIILGPTGVGISGIFQNIIELVRNATSFGINYTGVKKIAEASNDDSKHNISLNIIVLRRWSFATGILGLIIMVIFSKYFSKSSFSDDSHIFDIIALSLVILLSSVSAGQISLLQGLRKIKKMAWASVLGALLGTLFALPLYWILGLEGIVYSMILNAFITLVVSWYFSMKIKIEYVKISILDTFKNGIDMAKTGIFIVINGFIAASVLYVIRAIIIKNADIESVGLFQSVWTISTLYINILLNAMLADYFPRLSQFSDDDIHSNKLINEQLEINLLIGTPMIVIMLTLGNTVITLLYSNLFLKALPVFQWQIYSSFLTLIGWPLGVLYLARNKNKYMLISELIKQILFLSIVYFFWGYSGFNILGIAFFVSFLITLIFVIYSVKNISNFKFEHRNVKNIIILFFLTSAIFSNLFIFEGVIQIVINVTIAFITMCYSLVTLNKRLNILLYLKSYLAPKK
jgi:PST family polysaccharide transporter